MKKELTETEAKNILAEMKSIKVNYCEKWTFPGLTILNWSLGILFTAIFLALVQTMMDYLSDELIFGVLLGLCALEVSLLGGVYIPIMLSARTNKFYTYSYKVKIKESVNELMVALRNVRVKGIRVMKINTMYNGNDMYLEIEYK